MRWKLIGQSAVVCVVVTLASVLPGHIVMATTLDTPAFLRHYGDLLTVLQGVILSMYGYWLCQRACGDDELKPAVYDKRIKQFVRDYGLIVAVIFLVMAILRTDVYWPFSGVGIAESLDTGVRKLTPEGNWATYMMHYLLNQGSLLSYLLVYLSYGWAKICRRVRIKLGQSANLEASLLREYALILVMAVIVTMLFM